MDATERRWAIRLFKRWVGYIEARLDVARSKTIMSSPWFWRLVRLQKRLRRWHSRLEEMQNAGIVEIHGNQPTQAW